MIIFKHLFYERKSDERFIKMANQLYLDIIKYIRNNDWSNGGVQVITGKNDKLIGIKINVNVINPKYDLEIEIVGDKDKYPAYYISDEKLIIVNANYIPNIGDWLKINDYDQFVDYFVANLIDFFPKTNVIHEIIHYFDDKYNFDYTKRDNIQAAQRFKGEDYFNSSEEINAYLLSSLHDYRNDIKRGKYQTFDKFKKSFIDYAFDNNWELFNDKNKRNIIKRMYNFWEKRINN